MIDEKTAKCIQIAMVKGEISPGQLADKMGRPPATISRWRKRGCDSVTALNEIAKHCGMDYAELMSLSE